jgi:hypothetical protein
MIQQILSTYDETKYQTNKQQSIQLYEQYTRERWFDHYGSLLKSTTKRILLVSDYNQDIG